jgi:BASS family bile acid:Na+ symporter
MTEALLLSLKLSVAALILAVGIGAKVSDVLYLWRRPALLLRSVLAMYVLVPFTAFAIAKLLPLSNEIRVALLILTASSGAPLLPRRLQQLGGDAYIFSLLIISSLLAIVLVPPWLALLAWHFDVETAFSAADIAAVMVKAFLLPLAIGMLVGASIPAIGDRVANVLSATAWVVFVLAGFALMALQWQVFLEVRGPGLAALLALMAISVAIGHALGGPEPEHRTALAIACCTRHLGVAVLAASAFRGPRVIVLLAAYIACASLVSIPYLRWRRRTLQATGRPQSGAG